jgi:hypothetical protein
MNERKFFRIYPSISAPYHTCTVTAENEIEAMEQAKGNEWVEMFLEDDAYAVESEEI